MWRSEVKRQFYKFILLPSLYALLHFFSFFSFSSTRPPLLSLFEEIEPVSLSFSTFSSLRPCTGNLLSFLGESEPVSSLSPFFFYETPLFLFFFYDPPHLESLIVIRRE
jgi:hypothetical protein